MTFEFIEMHLYVHLKIKVVLGIDGSMKNV